MSQQKNLYLFNRARIQDPAAGDPACLAFEQRWITRQLEAIAAEEYPADLPALKDKLAQLIAAEQADVPDSVNYVEHHMNREEFRILVQEFSVDGLTEAQSFYYVLPRLTLEAQMPMLRIMIDEFGSGNLKRAHTSLYIALLQELGMPVDLDFYINRIDSDSFAFVNQFFWLSLRADDASYFAGAITYLETAIPGFFECYTRACKRLGIQAHHYYSEHQHIDIFHAREGQRLLQAMQATQTLDPRKAWAGIRLASDITAAAFENAVRKARKLQALPFDPAATAADATPARQRGAA